MLKGFVFWSGNDGTKTGSKFTNGSGSGEKTTRKKCLLDGRSLVKDPVPRKSGRSGIISNGRPIHAS